MTQPHTTDLRFCEACRSHVAYVQSLEGSFCLDCGEPVRLESPSGVLAFRSASIGSRFVNSAEASRACDSLLSSLP